MRSWLFMVVPTESFVGLKRFCDVKVIDQAMSTLCVVCRRKESDQRELLGVCALVRSENEKASTGTTL